MALKGERDALKAEGMDKGCPLYAEKAEYEPKFTVEEWERFWTDHPPEPF